MLTVVPSRPTLRLEALEARDVPSAYDLGDAAAFNAFFFTDMTAFNSDVHGRVAVGNHGTFTNYGIGQDLPNSDGTRDDLITGNDTDYTNGQVFNGNIVYGGVGNLESVGIPNGDERQEQDVVDFASIRQDLTDKSNLWGGEAPNGTTRARRGTIILRGTNAQLDIFRVTAEQLASAKSIIVQAPAGATILINVPGDDVSLQNAGLHLRGPDCSNILWNFYEADTLKLSGIGLEGSILAPTAALDFNNGQIEGTVIADSMTGNGQFHICTSAIKIVIPEYANLSGQVFIDEDANNLKDGNDSGYSGPEVILTGIDSLGRNIRYVVPAGFDGNFNFGRLWPGTYTVRVVAPQRFTLVLENGIPGTVDGATVGTPALLRVTTIALAEGDKAIDYLLPLVPPPN